MLKENCDITWRNPTALQMSALDHVFKMAKRKRKEPVVGHHTMVMLQANANVLAADMESKPIQTGQLQFAGLSEYELAEALLMFEGSLAYSIIKSWQKTPEIFGHARNIGVRGVEAAIKIVESGRQADDWWDIAKLWPDTGERATQMAHVVAVCKLGTLQSQMFRLLPFFADGLDIDILRPPLDIKMVTVQLLQRYDKSFAKVVADTLQETYVPAKCACPECERMIAPYGIAPRPGDFRNFKNSGACCKEHSHYVCQNERCVLQYSGKVAYHTYRTKVGQAHLKYRKES